MRAYASVTEARALIVRVDPAKPILRSIAAEIGVDLPNGSGNRKNTRQLGADVIHVLQDA